jgi:hypothetical protein
MPVFRQKRQKNVASNLTRPIACNPCITGLTTVYRFLQILSNPSKPRQIQQQQALDGK